MQIDRQSNINFIDIIQIFQDTKSWKIQWKVFLIFNENGNTVKPVLGGHALKRTPDQSGHKLGGDFAPAIFWLNPNRIISTKRTLSSGDLYEAGKNLYPKVIIDLYKATKSIFRGECRKECWCYVSF